MKRFILFIIALVIAVWLGLLIKSDPGYLLLTYRHWYIETPLWLAIVLLLILIIVCHWFLRLLSCSLALPERLHFWSTRRKALHARNQANKGLIALTEGNFAKAEKLLVKSAAHSDIPLINYLAAARAAQELSAYERRDIYLRHAHIVNPDAEIAVGLTQAELQLNHRQYEQALATLNRLREMSPRHKTILKLLEKVLLRLKDWLGLLSLLPQLHKTHVINTDQFTTLMAHAYEQLLTKKMQAQDNDVKSYWESEIPKRYKVQLRLVKKYIEYLINIQGFVEAEQLIRDTLKHQWDDQLITFYGDFVVDEGKRQLHFAESCIKRHKNNAALYLCLGRLCVANQLWGKAREFLEESITIRPSALAYYELANLFEKMQNQNAAIEFYRKAATQNGLNA